MSDARRVPSLDGLRGVAAVAVMEFHFALFFVPQAGLFKVFPYLHRAYLSVDFFFLISGFVMAHVYGQALASNWRAHWLKFAIARFARLYPAFVITTVTIAIVLLVSHTPIPFVSLSGYTLMLQPFLLQQWASGLSWNYPSWSISTEAEAYIYFIFFAGLLMTGRNPRLVATSCLVVLAALSLMNHGSLNFFVGAQALLRTLAEFSLGVLLYRENSAATRPPPRWIGLSAVFLAACAMATKMDFLMMGAFACLIYYCVNARDALVARFLNSRPIVALGNWSYSIYLWQAPIHYLAMATFALFGHSVLNLSPTSARLLLLATNVTVIAMSAGHTRYVEMPVRRQILNFIHRTDRIGEASGAPPLALS